tara:strand:- start:9801 stop:9974 length:174 start_codon:yes stop_codon:yes gene_type:complete
MNNSRLALIAKAVNNVQNKPKQAFINTQELKTILDNDYVNIQISNDSIVKINELDFS